MHDHRSCCAEAASLPEASAAPQADKTSRERLLGTPAGPLASAPDPLQASEIALQPALAAASSPASGPRLKLKLGASRLSRATGPSEAAAPPGARDAKKRSLRELHDGGLSTGGAAGAQGPPAQGAAAVAQGPGDCQKKRVRLKIAGAHRTRPLSEVLEPSEAAAERPARRRASTGQADAQQAAVPATQDQRPAAAQVSVVCSSSLSLCALALNRHF